MVESAIPRAATWPRLCRSRPRVRRKARPRNRRRFQVTRNGFKLYRRAIHQLGARPLSSFRKEGRKMQVRRLCPQGATYLAAFVAMISISVCAQAQVLVVVPPAFAGTEGSSAEGTSLGD